MLLLFALAALIPAMPRLQTSPIRFSINESRSRIPISPYIYGTNQPDWEGSARHLTLTRIGGNRWTAYNWETNASNAGNDYMHQNDGFLGGGETPGEAVRPAVAAALKAGAAVIVTVPMAGYVSADKNGNGDVNKSGDYLHTRFIKSLPHKPTPFAYPPDTHDNVVYQDEFVSWLEKTFPPQNKQARVFYSLDNEPDIWDNTHARLRTQKLTYAELLQRSIDYGRAIKAAAPGSQIFGPASYGWGGFSNLQSASDANGRAFLDFYLAGMKTAEKTVGTRILDALDVHWYPEAKGGGKRITEGGNGEEVVNARLQAPRSLWDAAYKEDSWIANDVLRAPIRLLPRLKEQIANNYPGTKLAITEYNYGGGNHISGALAQADVLGIFGREGVYAAALWHLAQDESFVYGGFDMYRNFDGKDGHFGDTSVSADTDDVEKTSVYASVDSAHPGRMVIVALNKTLMPLKPQFAIASLIDFQTMKRFELSGVSPHPRLVTEAKISLGHTAAGAPKPKSKITTLTLSLPLPPMSVTTLLLER